MGLGQKEETLLQTKLNLEGNPTFLLERIEKGKGKMEMELQLQIGRNKQINFTVKPKKLVPQFSIKPMPFGLLRKLKLRKLWKKEVQLNKLEKDLVEVVLQPDPKRLEIGGGVRVLTIEAIELRNGKEASMDG